MTKPDFGSTPSLPAICFRHCLEGCLLRVRHKQECNRGIILLLPQAAVLPGSDAGIDGLEPASGFVIQNRQTSCFLWYPMYAGMLLRFGLRSVQGHCTRNSVKKQDPICA